jgi:hypothetical protein
VRSFSPRSVIEDLDDAELPALDALLEPAMDELLPLFLPRRAK